jgi:RNA polymerase sigma factor (sigma-70 family)
MEQMALAPFQTLLDEHGAGVRRFLVAAVGAGDADDCLQETWISALRAYPRLRPDSNVRGWLLTIASRKAIDCHRRRRREAVPTSELPEIADPSAAAGRDGVPGVPAVWRLVGDLPEKQRLAIALRFIADASHAEIATAMSVSEEAARRNVHEGLKKLRKAYAR